LVYYQLDHLGTPIAAHNAKGEAVWTAEYEAWGRIRNETVSDDPKVNIPFRFQGQYYDEESGLHYNRFRYYDPQIGRFISQDPIGFAGSDNFYEYASNPIVWVDPWGLQKREPNYGRTGCGLKGMVKFQDHHIISDTNKYTKNHPLLIKAGGVGLLQNPRNKIMLPTDPSYHPTKSIHCGRHDEVVNRYLSEQMDSVVRDGKQKKWNQEQYKSALFGIMDAERIKLISGERALNKNRRKWAKPLPGQL